MRKAKDNAGYLLVVFFITITLAYVLARGESLYIAIHDHLDGMHAYYAILRENGLFWQLNAKMPLLGGLDRNVMPSEYKLYSWLFMLLPPYAAMIAGWFLRIIISVCGFCFLAQILYADERKQSNLAAVCGLAYGIFPSFVTEGISFASLPLLLGILILVYREPKKIYFVLLFLYPVLSSFIFFGIFICGYLVLFFLINWGVKRKPAVRMLAALMPVLVGYILTEWRMFYSVLFSGEQSMRSDFKEKGASFLEALRIGRDSFLNGATAANGEQIWLIFPVILVWCVVFLYKSVKNKKGRMILREPIIWLLIWILANCCVAGLGETTGFHDFIKRFIPALSGFGFSRTLWFNPFLWYFVFYLVLARIRRRVLRIILPVGAVLVVCLVPNMYNPIIFNVPGVYGTYAKLSGKEDHLSYGEFYSKELFDTIKEDIDYEGEWTAAYGMHPSVLQYNGIATLDGYFTLYPLSYKESFRDVIAPELAVDEVNRTYYDEWGGRAYLFSTDVSYQPKRTLEATEAELLINPKAFRDLGGELIISRVSILNAEQLGMTEVGTYKAESSPYTISVYRFTEEEE